MQASEEALLRKRRSIDILRREGVPFIDHLPAIEPEAETKRRSPEEVAIRAMALCVVAVKGVGAPPQITQKMLERFHLSESLTPLEREFIAGANAGADHFIAFSWRYESYWTLLWALNFIDDMGRPEQTCDVDKASVILRDLGRDKFVSQANLRPQSEILDAADLIYRYHWAVRSAALVGDDEPAGLHGLVVEQLHHALNWLIGYENQEWDNVSTDT